MDKGTGITSPINRQNRKSTAGNSREDYTPSNRRRKGRIFRGTFVPRRGRRKTVSQTGQRTKKKIPHSTGGGEREAVAATLYAATLLLVNKQRDRKGRAVLCSRFFLGLGSLRALCDVYRCKQRLFNFFEVDVLSGRAVGAVGAVVVSRACLRTLRACLAGLCLLLRSVHLCASGLLADLAGLLGRLVLAVAQRTSLRWQPGRRS